jgi:hypothetical protein
MLRDSDSLPDHARHPEVPVVRVGRVLERLLLTQARLDRVLARGEGVNRFARADEQSKAEEKNGGKEKEGFHSSVRPRGGGDAAVIIFA